MAADMRRLIERERGPLPDRPERYRVFELVAWSKSQAPDLERAVWAIALEHEWRAMGAAALEPGALDAVGGARRAGVQTALWTNNARPVTLPALERLGLAPLLDLVVTRDDMTALKPDPDGWRIIAEHFGARQPSGSGLSAVMSRSEEHTSELQSRLHLVCRLLLEKKKRDETTHQV